MFLIGAICFLAGYFLCLVVVAAVNDVAGAGDR
jgi:hypothetical protein|nr:MAG TPA: Herpesvirus UL41A [Caudoviricetes sp.]